MAIGSLFPSTVKAMLCVDRFLAHMVLVPGGAGTKLAILDDAHPESHQCLNQT